MSAVLKTPIAAGELRVVDPNFRAECDDDKLGVLDVKVETPYGVIDVEIQVRPHVHLIQRLVYYTSRMYVEQLGKGQNYGRLSRSISIIIVDFPFIKKDSVCHHRFRLYDRENDVEFSDALEINVLEIPKVREDDVSPVGAWLRFFAAKTEDDFMELAQTSPAIEEAWGVIKQLSDDERERMLAEDREKARRDNAAYYETGYIAGRQEGRQELRRAVVNMVNQGLTFEQISCLTGIALDEVTAFAGK